MADPVSDDWFDDVQAVLDADAADAPEESSAPELDSAPSTDEPIPAEGPSEATTPVVAESSAPVAEPTPVQPNWDSPDNPHYAAAQRLAQMETIQRAFQERKAAELRQQQLAELADGDPAQVVKLRQFVEQAQQPLVQQLQATGNELETAAKLATVTEQAVQLVVPPEYQERVFAEVRRMMAIPGGPEILRNDIDTRTSIKSQYETEIQKLQGQIAELQKRTAARTELEERARTGADLVGAGAGTTGSFAERFNAASNFEEAFDAIADDLGLRQTG